MRHVQTTTAIWRTATEHRDANALGECLAADVTLISPLTGAFRFEGRERVHEVFTAAFEVIEEIRFHTEVGDDSVRALFFRGRCARQPLEEAQLLRFDQAGLIHQLTLFGRPLPGVTAVMAAIGPRLLHQQSRPVAARLIGMATRPLATLTRLGERHVVPIADPARAKANRGRRSGAAVSDRRALSGGCQRRSGAYPGD